MTVKYSSYSMKKRLLALIVLVAFFVCGITARIFYLQVIASENIVKRGLTQWLRDLPLTASRGVITDRNGVVLASSHTTYDIYVRPSMVEDEKMVSYQLSNILGLDYDKMVEEFNEYLFDFTSKISIDDIRKAEKEQKKNRPGFPSRYVFLNQKLIFEIPILNVEC